MQNAKLVWVDPTSVITGIEVSMRVSGAPSFTVVNTVAKGIQTLTVPDLVDGTYDFRVVAVNGSKRSAGAVVTGKVETPPGDVTGLVVTFI